MTTGVVEFRGRLPKDLRDWSMVLRRLNRAIQYAGDQAVLGALTTISERSGTNLDSIQTYIVTRAGQQISDC